MALASGTTRCTAVTDDEVAERSSRRSYVKRPNCPVAATMVARYAVRRSEEAAVDAAAATAARPASSKQQRSLENSFAVQSRESIDEKIAACFYANGTSFATQLDGVRRRAGARARAVVGRWAHTRTPTRTRGGRCRLLGLENTQNSVRSWGFKNTKKTAATALPGVKSSAPAVVKSAGWCTSTGHGPSTFGLRSAGLGGGSRTQCASHPRPTETRARSRGSAHAGGRLSFGRLASRLLHRMPQPCES